MKRTPYFPSIIRCFPFLMVLAFLCFQTLAAQDLQETKKLFAAGKFAEAKAGIELLLKKTPQNPSYNQWYGVCLFETGEYDKSEKYLKSAASKSIQESFLYLGKLYYLQYNFRESATAYEQYIEILKKNNNLAALKRITPLLEKSRQATRMLTHTEDVQVIDSVVVDKDNFLNYYMLSDESGTLTPRDGDKISIYTNQLQNKRYYAKIHADSIYQLYYQTKLMDDWTDETQLPKEINSSHTNYPYVLTDGITIYFASQGHTSIGGYDLFVSRYSSSKETFLEPEQLGMPFNSIYNDYMLAIDDVSGIGFFATDRYQAPGKIIIYTFLPNQEKKPVAKENTDLLKERAKLTSIEATWRKGQDYGKITEDSRINKQNNPETLSKKEFVFIVDDHIIYESLSDFKSDAARSLYAESRQLAVELSKKQRQLNKLRLDYALSSGENRKTLEPTILEMEKSLEDIDARYDKLVISARNVEIKYLQQHKRK
jgi:tetratricopeptide (TPR) repeat protein